MCHENCKTCNQSGTNDNNNCIKCKDEGTMYFNYGNCLTREECTNGVFIDDDSIKRCKCLSDIKCNLCDEEYGISNLCLSCNMEEDYYPKKDEINEINTYINCYKYPQEGYYLKDQAYEQCYLSCKNCTELGSESDNKCTECKSTYERKNDFENDTNCYLKCQNYYYYDSDNIYKCTTEERCPEEYDKLIGNKRRCIDICKNDNLYQYEYQNKCYNTCPTGTKQSLTNDSFLCEKIIEEDKEKCHLIKKELIDNDEIVLQNDIESISSISMDYANQYWGLL